MPVRVRLGSVRRPKRQRVPGATTASRNGVCVLTSRNGACADLAERSTR